MKLTPRELIYFAELWRALGMRQRDAGRLLETRMARKRQTATRPAIADPGPF